MTSDTQPEIRPYVSGSPLHPPSQVLLQYPIVLAARQRHGYFLARESFSMFTMFSNPMMLFMVFGVVMMLATPYLIKNMDPESLKELKEQQTKMANMQNAIASGTRWITLWHEMSDSLTTPQLLYPTKPTRWIKANGGGTTGKSS
ncbi:hypothetical protein AMATHDRAFT_190 [Amanita thiersii Skay4041]|uniref:ER membrane protein complex subunit 7 beta-sandwich domain-containing protein n=1 Tax=Amanita thiersii Skay4041 TaxID=703135 RepID=A0A2A9P0L8_9AGAR|nr:hypothetical protein AMATHDRAFT_190 [Amanita thiersii Skay4041]